MNELDPLDPELDALFAAERRRPGPSAEERARVRSAVAATRARAALRAGDTTTALAELDVHERDHAQGVLAEERDALRVMSLAKAGRVDEARTQAAAFVVRYPQSVFRPALRAAAGFPVDADGRRLTSAASADRAFRVPRRRPLRLLRASRGGKEPTWPTMSSTSLSHSVKSPRSRRARPTSWTTSTPC